MGVEEVEVLEEEGAMVEAPLIVALSTIAEVELARSAMVDPSLRVETATEVDTLQMATGWVRWAREEEVVAVQGTMVDTRTTITATGTTVECLVTEWVEVVTEVE